MDPFFSRDKRYDLYKPDRGALFACAKRRPSLRDHLRRWWRRGCRAAVELAWQVGVAAVQRRVWG